MRTCLALLFIAAAGCGGNGDSLVVVNLSADAPIAAAVELDVTATAGGKPASFVIHPTGAAATLDPGTMQSFGIRVPASIGGTVHVHVDALDGSGASLASGDAEGPIKVGGRTDLSLLLVSAVTPPSGDDMATPPPPDMAQTPIAKGPVLTADRTTQDFGQVTVGNSSLGVDVKVTNTGDQPSSAPTLTPSGNDVAEFAITSHCTGALAAGDACTVTVSFAPKSEGAKHAHFEVAAAMGGTVAVDLSGMATPPGTLTISADAPANGDCGSTLIGTKSATVASYTVKNVGTSATGAPSVSTSDPQFTATGCATALQPAQTCTVQVSFTPSKRNKQVASVSVSATPGGVAPASVQGVGLAPASFTITSSTGSLDLGSAPRNGQGATVTFTAKNQGDVASPKLAPTARSGANAASFVLASDACVAATVAAGGTCQFAVQLAPTQSGPLAATFSIGTATTALGSVDVTGAGTPIWVQEATSLGTLTALTMVQAPDANHVYVGASDATLLQRDSAGTWTSQNIDDVPLQLSASSATNIWMSTKMALESSTGGTWSTENRPGAPFGSTSLRMFGVATFNSGDVWAAAKASASSSTTMYHYTSAAGWTTETGQSGSNFLWGTGDSDLYAFDMSNTGSEGYPVIYHRDATATWTRQYLGSGVPLNGGFKTRITAVFGVGKPASTLYATVMSTYQPDMPPLYSAGDSTWNPMANVPSGVTQCNSVWGASTTALWFACQGGIYTFDGGNWGATPFAPTGITFNALWGTSATNVYAVGQNASGNGVIYHLY